MTTAKHHKIVIQVTILLAAIFAFIVAYIANRTGSLTMGLIFLTTIQLIVLLAILFLLESVLEFLEAKK